MTDFDKELKEFLEFDPIARAREAMTSTNPPEATGRALDEIVAWRQRIIKTYNSWQDEKKKVRRQQIAGRVGLITTFLGCAAIGALYYFTPPGSRALKEKVPYKRDYRNATFYLDAQVEGDATWYSLEHVPNAPSKLSAFFPLHLAEGEGLRVVFAPTLKTKILNLLQEAQERDIKEDKLAGRKAYAPSEIRSWFMALSRGDGEVIEEDIQAYQIDTGTIQKTKKTPNPEYDPIGEINGVKVFVRNEQYTTHDGKPLDAVGLYYDDLRTPVTFGKFSTRELSATFARDMEENAHLFPNKDAIRREYDSMDNGVYKGLLIPTEHQAWFKNILPGLRSGK